MCVSMCVYTYMCVYIHTNVHTNQKKAVLPAAARKIQAAWRAHCKSKLQKKVNVSFVA